MKFHKWRGCQLAFFSKGPDIVCCIYQTSLNLPYYLRVPCNAILYMSSPAYIVRTGIITPIGNDTEACLRSLEAGRSSIGLPRILQTAWAEEIPVGEVGLTNEELADGAGVPATWPRTALLSAVAVLEAWAPFAEKETPFPVAFCSANTVGGMDLTES